MINDLLDIAELESGSAGLLCENVEPRSLVQSAQDDMRPMVAARGSQLVVQIASGLPSVFVDARQIGHVFSNLISNAATHSKPGDEIVVAANEGERKSAILSCRPRSRFSRGVSIAAF